MRLIPAILAGGLEEFSRLIRVAEELSNYVQIDLMDGKFVPSRSIGAEDLKGLRTFLRSEAHLMVKDPPSYLSALKEFGTEKVIFHYEAVSHPQALVKELRNAGFSVGIALSPGTPVSVLDGLVELVDSVLCLTVDPGFYGHKFLPGVLDKVRELRAANQEIEIGIDGGIKAENLEGVLKAGADVVYVGSAIFLEEDPRQSYQQLKARVESAAGAAGRERLKGHIVILC